MIFLVTAGPTYEPIDPVRFIGNRSSGKMGAALATAAMERGHEVTLIVGPVCIAMPAVAKRIDVESSQQMHEAVLSHFPACDILIMAAAVADYRPRTVSTGKLARGASLSIDLVPTADIVAAASAIKQAHQRTIGFSLEQDGDLTRARKKLLRKNLDLIVFNPTETMNADTIAATLLYRDGPSENLPCRSKAQFADILIERAVALI
jgi:phosphopantothenoylcysteine decarboxylase/phosphopantothenate--cysteine ligase